MRQKNRRMVFLLIWSMAMCLVMASGVYGDESREEKQGPTYFCYDLDPEGLTLISREYHPMQEDVEFMIRDLMQLLNSKTAKGKELNLLPEEVSINSYELKGETLVIDFNEAYESISRVRELLVRAGVVKTFLQVPGIHGVRFTVEGEELTDSRGLPYEEMTMDTFVEYSGSSDVSEYCFDSLTLYFTNTSGKKLIPEERNVYYKRTLPKERVVMEQLVRGPMVKGNMATVPGNLTIQSVTVSDGICYINLDDSFIDYANRDLAEEVPIYSIVNSILASCQDEKVQISVGRNANRVYGENYPLYHFYEFYPDIIKEE